MPLGATTGQARPTPRPSPPPDTGTGSSQVYERATSGRREIALTFDAGADRGYAAQILDTLARYGVKASFGITGHWARENPDLVKWMVRDGHMVFNHTFNHRSFTGGSTTPDQSVLTTEGRRKELAATEQEIRRLTGYEVKPYFRPPYGDLDASVLSDVAAAGYPVTVMWTCDTLGWNGASADEIVNRCAAGGSLGAAPGSILLLHVGFESRDSEALPKMIETLQAQGLTFVTVEQLLQP